MGFNRINMINKIAIICPTYGRPKSFNQIFENWQQHNTDLSDFYFVFEENEVHLQQQTQAKSIIAPSGTRGMVRPLNFAANILSQHYKYILFVGDDHRFRTADWDAQFIQAFENLNGTGYVYAPEGYHNENLATACAFSSNIVRAIGYACLPTLKHLFVDVYWMDMMAELGKAYLPNVFIEHMHPVYGKSNWDENYTAVNDTAIGEHDKQTYEHWKLTQKNHDIDTIKSALKL